MPVDEFSLEITSAGDITAKWYAAHPRKLREEQHGRVDVSEYLCDHIDYFVSRVRNGTLKNDGTGYQLLGDDLYRVLFPSAVGELFKKALDAARANRNRVLKLWISVDRGCPDVVEWPLEYLCVRRGEDVAYLATHDRLTFARRVSTSFTNGPLEPPPMRVLVVVSSPRGVPNVNTKAIEDVATWAATSDVPVDPPSLPLGNRHRATVPTSSRKLITPRVLGNLKAYERTTDGIDFKGQPATFSNLAHEMEWRPQVVHFIGHGRVKDGVGEIALTFPNDRPEWVSANSFLQLCQLSPPKLILLQACDTALPYTGRAFLSFANQLLAANVPAVVAMQFEMRNDYATAFATGFYEALAVGSDVDEAVQKGRQRIAISAGGARWNERHFGTPVLFAVNPSSVIRNPNSGRTTARSKQRSVTATQGVMLGAPLS